MDESRAHENASRTKALILYRRVEAAPIRHFRRVLAALLLLFCLNGRANAESQYDWRFWGVADGMEESYTYSASLDAEGRIWLVHGAVGSLSILDGTAVKRIVSPGRNAERDRKSTRLNSSHTVISYAVFCLKKKKKKRKSSNSSSSNTSD